MDGPIVVGIDGSASSRAALRWAAREAALRGVPLHVVAVWHIPWAAYAGVPLPDSLPDDLRGSARDALARELDALGDLSKGVEVVPTVVEGDAAQVLVEAARGAELLVVGSRGLGGFRGLMLGSVSHHCAQQASCPVVIVRATDEGVKAEPGEGAAA